MDKVSERSNVLTETENKSFIHAIINAVTKGYADNIVLEDVMDLVRRKEISKGVLLAAPDALRTYGKSLNDSLKFIADQIEQLEVIDEPTVTKKQPVNVVEEEINKQDAGSVISKKTSIDKFSNLEVSEDWSKYSYDKKTNIMSGHLKIDFKQDLTCFKNGNKIILSEIDIVLNKIYDYLTNEFKHINKEALNCNIFKNDIKFVSVEKGIAETDYEIKGAF